ELRGMVPRSNKFRRSIFSRGPTGSLALTIPRCHGISSLLVELRRTSCRNQRTQTHAPLPQFASPCWRCLLPSWPSAPTPSPKLFLRASTFHSTRPMLGLDSIRVPAQAPSIDKDGLAAQSFTAPALPTASCASRTAHLL